MLPHLLLRPRRVDAGTKYRLHLLHAQEENVPRNIPPHALRARRASQTTPVRPKLMEPIDLAQRQRRVKRHIRMSHRLGIAETDQIGQLAEEATRRVSRIDAEGKNHASVASRVGVHKVHLCFAPVALHRVIRWSVDVPAREVDRLVPGAFIESHGRETGKVAWWVGECECRPIAPVKEVARGVDVTAVAKAGDVVQRETLGQEERDWRLLGPCLAEMKV